MEATAAGVTSVFYVIVASKQADRRGLSAASATEALAIVDDLYGAAFRVEHIIDESARETSLTSLRRTAEMEEAAGAHPN